MQAILTDYSDPPLALLLSPTPATFPGDEAMSTRSWEVLEGPSGADTKSHTPPTYTVEGTFFGGSLFGFYPFAPAESWRPPADLVFQLRTWMRDRKVLRYRVTDTDIDADVKITHLGRTWGDLDHLDYHLELLETAPLLVTSVAATPAEEAPAGRSVAPGVGIGPIQIPETWIVKDASETVWLVGNHFWSNVEMGWEVYDLNRADRGLGPITDPEAPLEVGWHLKLPGGVPGLEL